ncbi:tyramine oxidase [Oceanicola sp. D3]|uniref:copper amine oxidase n=1 Tax=Oceanicola sp. D3 TaxID=2587163 RepID=UPI001124C9EA|nr:tyramine oxidase [Oceanicola sp. D3]QDC10614.1 tyramine oxidase [Oceanicola sp. D3]
MRYTSTAAIALATALLSHQATAQTHPLDGLTADEFNRATQIARDAGITTEQSLFPMIDLQEPPKSEVLAFEPGDALTRRAIVHHVNDEGFFEAIVNLTSGEVESNTLVDGQSMVLFSEFMQALEITVSDERVQAGLAKRGLTPDDVFCLPLTAGNFFTDEYDGTRLMKVPCYVLPGENSNWYAKPIEGLYTTIDLKTRTVIDVIDKEPIPLATDHWGYTEDEVAERAPLRPETNPVTMTQEGGPNFTIEGSNISWDLFDFNLRTEKRAGLVLSNINVMDGDVKRPIIYQTHLSEVFVPYMDPSEGWYWRTYMDSGEYGFGLFMTPLEAGIDCPAHATFLPSVISDDFGKPIEIPNAICIFERNIGDPAWRHFEIFAQGPETFVPAEGRPATELIVRSASQVGNYDYLIDYRFYQNADIRIMVGATGLDGVKGAAAASMNDPTAAEETKHGTLIAPHLVAANHDHYFNFKIDFDIDQPVNMFGTMDIVPAEVDPDLPRRSLWTVEHNMPDSEMDARYKISSSKPRYFHYSNPAREGHLGHTPGWMIHHGSIAYGPFDYVNDPSMKRNAYIEYSVWNTVYDPEERYAGGRYPFQSDGTDTLAEWVKEDQSLMGQDVVSWFSAGFHHIPRMEDWPVMSTEWKTIHLMPHNFFANNPGMTIRKGQ